MVCDLVIGERARLPSANISARFGRGLWAFLVRFRVRWWVVVVMELKGVWVAIEGLHKFRVAHLCVCGSFTTHGVVVRSICYEPPCDDRTRPLYVWGVVWHTP